MSVNPPVNDDYRVFFSSFARCSQNPGFYSFMFQRFRSEAPEFMKQCAVADKESCLKLLRGSTDTLLKAGLFGQKNHPEIQQLARVYADLGWALDDTMMKHWLNSLLYAVRCCDMNYNEVVMAVWCRYFMTGVAALRNVEESEQPDGPHRETELVTGC